MNLRSVFDFETVLKPEFPFEFGYSFFISDFFSLDFNFVFEFRFHLFSDLFCLNSMVFVLVTVLKYIFTFKTILKPDFRF